MKPSIEKLHKFFSLEANRGYDNKAVMGGLENILSTWEATARSEGISEETIKAVDNRLKNYHRLSPTSRKDVLKGLWQRIQRSTQTSVPNIPSEQSKAVPIRPAQPAPSRQKAAPRQPAPKKAAVPSPAAGKPAKTASSQKQPAAKTHFVPSNQPLPELENPLTMLDGIGPRQSENLSKLGLHTLRDMLYLFPRRYDDYSQLKPINRLWYGEKVTVIGKVIHITNRPTHNRKFIITEAVIHDGSAGLRATWFNQPWQTKSLKENMMVVLSGTIDQYLGRLVMKSPEWEPIEQKNLHTNRIVPVYPLTAKLTQKWLRRQMNQAVTQWAPRVPDPLSASIRQSAALMNLPTALTQIHFPDNAESLKAAQHRLAFDEIFLLQLGVLQQRQKWQARDGKVFSVSSDWLKFQIEQLPFPLTDAQQRTLEDITADLASGTPMNRLLQGDVGSGKTVIAALAAAIVTSQGSQAAIMAPTAILAEQHFNSLQSMLAHPGGVLAPQEIRLLAGTTPESEKKQIRADLENGKIKLIVGTHALIESPITFADLQLAVIDEQHRFGVAQRAALRGKNHNPHLLVMTATPIPRSLALTVYGDLDISILDEMPPNRKPVSTHLLYSRERERAYSLIRKQIQDGRQAFIVYPLVEESDKSESKAAVEEHARLQSDIFPSLKVGLLHGRMKPEEKERVMEQFRNGDTHILVATTVVEVGVDIPNASVMLIEGANRFGLAQLHQLRGRVGRGADKSYCLLIPEGEQEENQNERLQAMIESNDGFVLAERDLEQRGPGDFLGTRQSGYMELKLASLTDVGIIEKARKFSKSLFQQDPQLSQPEHQLLAQALKTFWQQGQGELS